MNIVKAVFERAIPDTDKLRDYGFIQQSDDYRYATVILDGDFRVEVALHSGEIMAVVIDTMDEREYDNVHIAKQRGAFVNQVREAFREVLIDIRTQCFTDVPFTTAQANRLAQHIYTQFGDRPEPFMGKNAQAFKTQRNQKWYGIIVNIHRHKITPAAGKVADNAADNDCRVDVLNLKVDSHQLSDLLTQTGYYPAYHMNKKHWVSIMLDDTLADEILMQHLIRSHELVSQAPCQSARPRSDDGTKAWVVPANPNYFDVIAAFQRYDTIRWKQSANIAVGDTVFLYLGAPYSAIMYRCVVVEADIASQNPLPKVKLKKLMRIKRLAVYDKAQFPLSLLKSYGLTSVRSARGMPEDLVKLLAAKPTITDRDY